MVDQWILKILLAPLALLYGLVIAIRNVLYSIGLLRGVTFSIPVISIGNLSVGGTGKTPHTEYLVRMLHEYLKIGIVSRGYKRKTTGYLEVNTLHDASQAGDEPVQYKRKFPDVQVAVGESRSLAIPLLVRAHPDLQIILLDDAFQHREVNPGLHILLTEYDRLYTRDTLLPVGRLREWRSAASRADVIVVTKCPQNLEDSELLAIEREVKTDEDQLIFFSRYVYGNPYRMYNSSDRVGLHDNLDVLLVTGIGGTEYLMKYVSNKSGNVELMEYNDHHPYSADDISDIEQSFQERLKGNQRIILTTEKDATRLDMHRNLLLQRNLPLYILPLRVEFIGQEPEAFDHVIKDWLLNFKR